MQKVVAMGCDRAMVRGYDKHHRPPHHRHHPPPPPGRDRGDPRPYQHPNGYGQVGSSAQAQCGANH